MAHLLVIELSVEHDGAVLSAAFGLGHRCTLAGVDPGQYRARPVLAPLLDRLAAMLALPHDPLLWPGAIAAMHRRDPFDALLCLDRARLADGARVAQALGLLHATPEALALCADLPALRARLAQAGVAQPPFECVMPDDTPLAPRVLDAVARVGLPAIIRTAEGQPAVVLRDAADLALWHRLVRLVALGPRDYGARQPASGAVLVERIVTGPALACVVLRDGGRMQSLGASPPALEGWVGRVLDAIGLDGVAQIDGVMTEAGPVPIAVHALPDPAPDICTDWLRAIMREAG